MTWAIARMKPQPMTNKGDHPMKRYFVHIPSWVYAMTCYGFNQKDAVARFRLQHGFTRMPKGYGIWEA